MFELNRDELMEPLCAYWVGDQDIFAARHPQQALGLANALAGQTRYSLADVSPVSAETLDKTLLDAQGRRGWVLRTLLRQCEEPGNLAGYER